MYREVLLKISSIDELIGFLVNGKNFQWQPKIIEATTFED